VFGVRPSAAGYESRLSIPTRPHPAGYDYLLPKFENDHSLANIFLIYTCTVHIFTHIHDTSMPFLLHQKSRI
jgi:hypothetical protein